MSATLSHLFLWLGVGDVGSRRTILENLEVGFASRFSGTQNYDQGFGRDAIVESYNEVKMPLVLQLESKTLKHLLPIQSGTYLH